MSDEKTTIQIDVKTRDQLRELAAANQRTMAGQFRWMVECEFDKYFMKMAEVVAKTDKKKLEAVKS